MARQQWSIVDVDARLSIGAPQSMRILLIASAYNGLTQRAHVELDTLGHEVSVTLALSAEEIRQALTLFEPDLIICPFLRERVPDDVWQQRVCIIIHPGIKGDRGASSLDWAIMQGAEAWGVTALQAAQEMDAGDIWSTSNFPMRAATKASIYRREVTQHAIKVMLEAAKHFATGTFQPEPLDYSNKDVCGKLLPSMKQADRAIEWNVDRTDDIIRKINAADSNPGLLDSINGENFHLYGVHKESVLNGSVPGEIIAQRHGAICRATIDGAVWISHLKRTKAKPVPFYKRWKIAKRPDFKLPAATILGESLKEVEDSPIEPLFMGAEETYKELWYQEGNGVGYLNFDFHNGAMSTEQCHRLLEAYRLARGRSTRVIVLMGGRDFWSNGIHLNLIEAAKDPAAESWRNINAIDDVVHEIITTNTHLTLSAVWGGAGAGGAIMPLACDRVCARAGCIMNPHYKTMGLYGSEYWTYLLPKRVGKARAVEMMQTPLPVGMKKAAAMGMIDDILSDDFGEFSHQIIQIAETMADDANFESILQDKLNQRAKDQDIKPLAAYRAAELKQMKLNFSGKFYGGDQNYHQARYNFVHKIRPKQTADYLARHHQLDMRMFQELRQPLTY